MFPKTKKLSILKCECNLLDSLDLSKNPAIRYVKCYGNRIKDEALTQMMESLPQDIIIEFDNHMLNNSTHCLTTGFTKACENNTRFVGAYTVITLTF